MVMLMYNLLKYSSNYSDTTGSTSFNSNDEANNVNANFANTNAFKSFKYESKLIGSIAAVNWSLENTTIVLLLKYQSNF